MSNNDNDCNIEELINKGQVVEVYSWLTYFINRYPNGKSKFYELTKKGKRLYPHYMCDLEINQVVYVVENPKKFWPLFSPYEENTPKRKCKKVFFKGFGSGSDEEKLYFGLSKEKPVAYGYHKFEEINFKQTTDRNHKYTLYVDAPQSNTSMKATLPVVASQPPSTNLMAPPPPKHRRTHRRNKRRTQRRKTFQKAQIKTFKKIQKIQKTQKISPLNPYLFMNSRIKVNS